MVTTNVRRTYVANIRFRLKCNIAKASVGSFSEVPFASTFIEIFKVSSKTAIQLVAFSNPGCVAFIAKCVPMT